MNKYLKRGLFLIIPGVALNILGYVIKRNDLGLYGWAMIAGTVLFGVGFLMIFYSLVRKVEYTGLVEERAAEAEIKERRKLEARRHKPKKMAYKP